MASGTNPAKGMWSSERQVRLMTALIGTALAILTGFIAFNRLGGSIRTLSYDLPFVLPRAPSADDIRIVYLDELDGQTLERSAQAELLDKLNEAGARAVVYDLLFDRPSKDPEVDRLFAAAMLRFRGVDEMGEPIAGMPRRQILLACGRQNFVQAGVMGERLIPPTDELLAAADDFGLVVQLHDKKFTVRELPTGTPDEATLTWKAAVALGAPLEEKDRLASRWLNYVGRPDPLDPAIKSMSAGSLLLGSVPVLLRDKVVVVGAKPGILGAVAGQDLFSTPYHRFDIRGDLPLTSGVEIQATGLANLLKQDWLTQADPRYDNWMVVAGGIIAGIMFSRLRPIHGLVAGAFGTALLAAAGTYTVHYHRVWFPWSVVAFLQMPVAFVWGTAAHFYVERFFRAKLGEEQRQLREAFAKYLSPQMLDRLTAEGFKMKVGGEKIEGAMMFTDLENFTDLCERVGDPERIVSNLNEYFERTTGHIFDDDGVVIKFIGDAIFAAWGAPIAEPQAALKAVRAAWKLSRIDRVVVDGTVLNTRIGVHFGEVVAGNIGSARRVDYTMIGDAVNLAARLESLNKTLGTEILISEEVNQRLEGEFVTRLVGRLKVKGRRELTVIYEVMGRAEDGPGAEWLGIYREAQAALVANDPGRAGKLFRAVEESKGEKDGPSRFFMKRLEAGDLIVDGVVEMTEK
ncbi:adenylate/guanylate cyclase domain-containing protein [Luteolibacter sp. Populi]|uniref:adenylate/guanylate cyclase domain-containing protein n=1 Tax=Luteolibacter sp. Populi TaxID=3230487 RepID=UPI0034655849